MKTHVKGWDSFQALLENDSKEPLLWAVTFSQDLWGTPSMKDLPKLIAIFDNYKGALNHAMTYASKYFILMRREIGMPRLEAAKSYVEGEVDGKMLWPIYTIHDLFKLGTLMDVKGALGIDKGVYDMEDLVDILSASNQETRDRIEKTIKSVGIRSNMF